MTKQDKADILKALVALAVAFDKEPSDERNRLYLDNLTDLPVGRILSAVRDLIRTSRYYPTIAEIRAQADPPMSKQSLEDEAAMEWDKLRTGNKDDALTNPTTKKCYRALGGGGALPTSFGFWDASQEQWKRKEFLALYCAYRRTGQAHKELTHEEAASLLERIPHALSN